MVVRRISVCGVGRDVSILGFIYCTVFTQSRYYARYAKFAIPRTTKRKSDGLVLFFVDELRVQYSLYIKFSLEKLSCYGCQGKYLDEWMSTADDQSTRKLQSVDENW